MRFASIVAMLRIRPAPIVLLLCDESLSDLSYTSIVSAERTRIASRITKWWC